MKIIGGAGGSATSFGGSGGGGSVLFIPSAPLPADPASEARFVADSHDAMTRPVDAATTGLALTAAAGDNRGGNPDNTGQFSSTDGEGDQPADAPADTPAEASAWKPTMTSEEADAWAKDSVIKEPLYHGTPITADAAAIRQDGFSEAETGKNTGNEGLRGKGIYLTSIKGEADNYALMGDPSKGEYTPGETLQTRVDVRNPANYFDIQGQLEGRDRSDPIALRDKAVALGHDAIIVPSTTDPTQIMEMSVFDPKNIVVVDDNATASAAPSRVIRPLRARAATRHRAIKKTEQARLLAAVEEATHEAVHELIHTTARKLHTTTITAAGPDDLNIITTLWPDIFDRLILPVIGDSWDLAARNAANLMRDRVARAVDRYGEKAVYDIVENARSVFMGNARLQFGRLGDAIEQLARLTLSEGFDLGESMSQLATRLMDIVPDMALPEANMVSRTAVVGASNAGSLAQARALGAEAVQNKVWIATDDERTREWHAEADGQVVGINEPFEVGGESVDFPGDGSPENVLNCRCCLGYENLADEGDAAQTAPIEIDTPAEEDGQLAAAGNQQHAGAMLALVPSQADCERMAVVGGEPVDQIHTTLLFLGDAVDWSPDAQAAVHGIAADLAANQPAFEAHLMAASTFGPPDDPVAVYLLSSGRDGASELARIHDAVAHPVLTDRCPDQFSPWVPHASVAYQGDPATLRLVGEPIMIDRVRVSFGDETVDYALGYNLTAAAGDNVGLGTDP